MSRATSFTFSTYSVDRVRSIVYFTYRVEFINGTTRTYTDRLFLKNVPPKTWDALPGAILEPTLQALSLMCGINYWTVFPTSDIRIEGFTLTKEQARFWDTLYTKGLGEFFYEMKMDFRNLIRFPYEASYTVPAPATLTLPKRALVFNGAGKDSILSAELLKEAGVPFDFFTFVPTRAHKRIAALVGANLITASRLRDPRVNAIAAWYEISAAYPSVSTLTFIGILLAELLGYSELILSNERSADFGNLSYLGLEVNHQWSKSSEVEHMINEYLKNFITPTITTTSLLRPLSELEIVRRFVRYPQYLQHVTSCNNYFSYSTPEHYFLRTPYWCTKCPKCVFLFACYSAFLPKKEVVCMFGANLYAKKRLIPLFREILGVAGYKPFDCVGEPEEMVLAMHKARQQGEYDNEPVMKVFQQYFPREYDFDSLEQKIFST